MNKPTISRRLARGLLLIKEFDIKVVDKLGKENVVTNFMSCLQVSYDCATIDDSFLDEHLFSIITHNPWYVNIASTLI